MLQEIAGEQVRYFSENNQYTADLTVLGYAEKAVDSPEGHYKISAATPTATNFILTATAIAGGAQANDKACGNFTLNAAGAKGVSGTDGAENCW